ncbi:cryptochrome/photolyase family protein [Massilibacterium senegalense]|uniref:cryptochrome/photolyase family protein n=1 Tax=Massilibacterium senegalense TaxID=1632858 RepID=UPI000782FFAE|nr:cryptochrome/photolyase family protein [Massilibacterium senegalense]
MITRWILGDQLNHALPIIKEVNKQTDVILFIEAMSRLKWQKYHKQKLVFIFSAMRHFAEELRADGLTVDYRQADSFSDAWKAHLVEFQPTMIKRTFVTDSRMNRALEKWERSLIDDIEVIVPSFC